MQVDGQPIFDRDGLMLQVGRLPVEASVRLTVLRKMQSSPSAWNCRNIPCGERKW